MAKEVKKRGRQKGFKPLLGAYEGADGNYYDKTYTNMLYTASQGAAILNGNAKGRAAKGKAAKKAVKTAAPKQPVKKATRQPNPFKSKAAVKQLTVLEAPATAAAYNAPKPVDRPEVRLPQNQPSVMHRALAPPTITLQERLRLEAQATGYYSLDIANAVKYLPYVNLMQADTLAIYRDALLFRVAGSMHEICSRYHIGKMCRHKCPVVLNPESEDYKEFELLSAALDVPLADLYNNCLVADWYTYEFIEDLSSIAAKVGYVLSWDHWLQFYTDGIKPDATGAQMIKRIVMSRASFKINWPNSESGGSLTEDHPALLLPKKSTSTEDEDTGDMIIEVRSRIADPGEILTDNVIHEVEPAQTEDIPYTNTLDIPLPILHHLDSGTNGLESESEEDVDETPSYIVSDDTEEVVQSEDSDDEDETEDCDLQYVDEYGNAMDPSEVAELLSNGDAILEDESEEISQDSSYTTMPPLSDFDPEAFGLTATDSVVADMAYKSGNMTPEEIDLLFGPKIDIDNNV